MCAALDAYLFLRDNKAFEQETNKILARTVSAVPVDACRPSVDIMHCYAVDLQLLKIHT